MSNIKMIFKGILAAALITILSGPAAAAEPPDFRAEFNVAGMTTIGNTWWDSVYLGRIGVGVFKNGFGLELGVIAAPWYGGTGAIIDGSFAVNPLSDKPISPVFRVGALTSTGGGFMPFIGGGLRIRVNGKFGFRAEYAYLISASMGAVTAGAFIDF
jgi:hypothetical protein